MKAIHIPKSQNLFKMQQFLTLYYFMCRTKISLKILPETRKSSLKISISKIGKILASFRPLKTNFELCVDDCSFWMPQPFQKCMSQISTPPLEKKLWNASLAHFHICQLLPVNQTVYIIYVVKVGKNLAKSLTPSKSPQYFFLGKKLDIKFQEWIL